VSRHTPKARSAALAPTGFAAGYGQFEFVAANEVAEQSRAYADDAAAGVDDSGRQGGRAPRRGALDRAASRLW